MGPRHFRQSVITTAHLTAGQPQFPRFTGTDRIAFFIRNVSFQSMIQPPYRIHGFSSGILNLIMGYHGTHLRSPIHIKDAERSLAYIQIAHRLAAHQQQPERDSLQVHGQKFPGHVGRKECNTYPMHSVKFF